MKNKKNMKDFCQDSWQCLQCYLQFLSPILSYAADVVPEEPPLYEKVKNELDADEVVKAKDLELKQAVLQVEKDFTGLKYQMKKGEDHFP